MPVFYTVLERHQTLRAILKSLRCVTNTNLLEVMHQILVTNTDVVRHDVDCAREEVEVANAICVAMGTHNVVDIVRC